MTTSASTSDSPRPLAARFVIPPFAGPSAAVAVRSADRQAIGPFVPAPWRTTLAASSLMASPLSSAPAGPGDLVAAPTPVVAAPVESALASDTPPSLVESWSEGADHAGSVDATTALPWINQFLATTPVVPMAAIDVPASIEPAMPTPWYNTPMATTPVVSHTPLGVDIVPPFVPPAVSASTAGDDSVVEDMTEMVADARVEMPLADEWPLAEASAAIDELSRDLTEDGSDSPSRLFGEVSAVVPLPAWSDDDLLNIMPTRPVTPIASHPVQELFAEEPAAEPEAAEHEAAEHQAADASALAAAQALEVLAQRVRNGELQLPGYDPRMGDAAALVSALAALLGIRLG